MRSTGTIIRAMLALGWLAGVAVAQLNVSSPSPVKDQASSSTGSAAPASAHYIGANSSGNLGGIVACDNSTQIAMSTATTSQIVALVSGKAIYVCGFVIGGGGATTAKVVYGTGTNCATGQVSLTPAFTLASATTVNLGGGLGYVMKAPSGNALCVTNSAAVTANVFIAYTQF
jgi:hypothetical protein